MQKPEINQAILVALKSGGLRRVECLVVSIEDDRHITIIRPDRQEVRAVRTMHGRVGRGVVAISLRLWTLALSVSGNP